MQTFCFFQFFFCLFKCSQFFRLKQFSWHCLQYLQFCLCCYRISDRISCKWNQISSRIPDIKKGRISDWPDIRCNPFFTDICGHGVKSPSPSFQTAKSGCYFTPSLLYRYISDRFVNIKVETKLLQTCWVVWRSYPGGRGCLCPGSPTPPPGRRSVAAAADRSRPTYSREIGSVADQLGFWQVSDILEKELIWNLIKFLPIQLDFTKKNQH